MFIMINVMIKVMIKVMIMIKVMTKVMIITKGGPGPRPPQARTPLDYDHDLDHDLDHDRDLDHDLDHYLDHDKQPSFSYKNTQIHQFCNKYELFDF